MARDNFKVAVPPARKKIRVWMDAVRNAESSINIHALVKLAVVTYSLPEHAFANLGCVSSRAIPADNGGKKSYILSMQYDPDTVEGSFYEVLKDLNFNSFLIELLDHCITEGEETVLPEAFDVIWRCQQGEMYYRNGQGKAGKEKQPAESRSNTAAGQKRGRRKGTVEEPVSQRQKDAGRAPAAPADEGSHQKGDAAGSDSKRQEKELANIFDQVMARKIPGGRF